MATTQQTSFTTPSYDYGVDLSQIERRRALAQALQKESLSPIEQPGTPAGGFTPRISPFQGLAKIASAYAGKRQQEKADTQQHELAAKSQRDYQQMLATGLKQLRGTAATPLAEDASGNVTPAQPAVAPDPAAALGTFGSHPMGAQMTPLAMQQMQREQMAAALRGGAGGGSPMQPGPGASVMAGSGTNPVLPQSAATGPRLGGPAAGLPMDVWLQQDPSGGSYLKQLAADWTEGQKPVVNRGYGIGTMQQGRYVADPSSTEQALGMERAKAGMGVHNVTQASGAVVPMFGNQLPGFGGLPGTPGPTQAPAAAQIPAMQTPRPAGAPQAAPGALQGDPWSTMPRRVEPQGIGESTFHKSSAVQQADTAAKLAEKYGSVAQTANERKSFNDQALQMLPQATTGPGALSITGVQSFLNSRFGIPLDQLSKANSGDAAATQELNKNLLNAATKTAKANYGSRMTQSEVMLQIQQGSPNVDMTRAAINYLLRADNARADYEIKQGQDVGRYLQQGGDPYQFDGWYSRSFPMSKAIQGGVQSLPKQVVNSGSNYAEGQTATGPNGQKIVRKGGQWVPVQ